MAIQARPGEGSEGSDGPPSPSRAPSDDDIQAAGNQPRPDGGTRWFAYIAVGITLAAILVSLVVMARIVYAFFARQAP